MSSPTDRFSLAGKTALLTGASSGIGRRFAQVLAEAGATVGIVARREEVLKEISGQFERCVPFPADLSAPEAADELARAALEELGPIDILVNNAASIAGGVKAEDETLEIINTTLNVNLVSPIRLAQALFPSMKERGSGSIINVTSIVASVGIGRFPQAVYSASKGGLEAITREWAAQWSRYGIRINSIAPGFIETGITAEVINRDNIQQWIGRNTLIPRHGQVEDFDGVLLYLASDMSSYVTGQTLTVDGGWTAR